MTKPGLGVVARRGLTATVIAAVVNIVLFLIGSLFTFPADAITPMGVPVDVTAVAAITTMAGVLATVGYFVLTRVMALKTANRVMLILTILALIGMAFNPFSIANVPAVQIVVLEIMHLVAALPAITLLRA